MAFLLSVVVNAVAVWVASWLVDGIEVGGSDPTERAVTLAAVGLIFAVVNALVRPVAMLLSLPFLILTLGLFALVVNAVMLMLTSWLAGELGLAFSVEGFWWEAVLGALVITIVSMILNVLLPDGKRSA